MNYEYYDYKMASDWLYFAETRDNNCYSFVKSKIYYIYIFLVGINITTKNLSQ